MSAVTAIGAGIGLLLLAGGAVSGWIALRAYRYGEALERATPYDETTGAGSIVSVEGTAEESSDDVPLDSYLGGTSCLAYAYEIVDEKSARSGQSVYDGVGGVYTSNEERGEDAVPFVVDADGQRVHVDAPDAHLAWSGSSYDEVSGGTVVRNRGSVFKKLLTALRYFGSGSDERRRYFEACLQPGDPVTVVGTARPDGGEVTLERTREAPLVVSTSTHQSIPAEFRSRATSRAIWAAILVAVGGYVLLRLAGVV